MATPGFFAPVEWDGRLLTDGGVANYLPISVARALGADHVVAVDVSRPHPRIRRTDPAAMGGRAIGLLMRNAAPDTTANVMIRPDIDTDFSGAFFLTDPSHLYRLGADAVMEVFPPRHRQRRPVRVPPPPPETLAALELEVADPTLQALAERVFRDIAPAAFESREVLERVDRLYATGLVDGVWPRVESRSGVVTNGGNDRSTSSDRAATDVLVLRVDGMPRRALAITPGYENDRGGRIWGKLSERLAMEGVPLELSLAGATTGLDRWGAASAKLYTLGLPLSWVVGGYLREVETRDTDSILVRDADELEFLVQDEVYRAGGWLSSEYRPASLRLVSSLAMHVEEIDVANGPEGVAWGPSLRIVSAAGWNKLVGVAPEVEAELRFGEVYYASAALRMSHVVSLRGLVAAGVLDVGFSVDDAPPDARRALGDHHAMPGLAWGEGRGAGHVLLGLDLARSFFTAGTLRARLRAGAAPSSPDELWEELSTWTAGAALEGLWSLPFGPILVGVGANTDGDFRLDVGLGPVF
jgi:hypothetical protein